MIPAEVMVPVLAAVLWHLGALATLTYKIRTLYPPWLESWMSCPACSGTWMGAGVTLVLGERFLGFEGRTLPALVLAGLWCTFWVPLLAWVHTKALATLHDEEEPDAEG